MTEQLLATIRAASQPMAPLPTSLAARITPLPEIRAVLFDMYGTLLISGSGDVGSADPHGRHEAFVAAFKSVGLPLAGDGSPRDDDMSECLKRHIQACHARQRDAGVDFPEVDIVEIWRGVVGELVNARLVPPPPAELDFRRLAVEYEVRANPVWPMPGLDECLDSLRGAGQILGIISNAQFFTPLAFEAVAGKSLDDHEFDAALRYYSYEHGRGKPDLRLFEMAAAALAQRGVRPEQVLYLGNDMRNDVWPAAAVGFRTALFAGDQRSLRLREQEAESKEAADAVVTHLNQVRQLLV